MQFRLHVVAAAVFLLAGAASAQTQSTGTAEQKPTALLRLCFRDSERGTAVVPDALLIDGKMVFSRIDEAGRLDLALESGDHMLQVNARGYKQMDARETALPESPPLNIITLDPVTQPQELKPANLSRFMKPDHATVVGFVVDDDLGKPLEGVEVKLADDSAKTETDANGFFGLSVPMSQAGPVPDDPNQKFVKRSLIISKDGYGAEERRNVLLLKENPKIWQVRLQQGGTTNVVDEENTRGGLQQWIFGETKHDDDDDTTATHNHDDHTSH